MCRFAFAAAISVFIFQIDSTGEQLIAKAYPDAAQLYLYMVRCPLLSAVMLYMFREWDILIDHCLCRNDLDEL